MTEIQAKANPPASALFLSRAEVLDVVGDDQVLLRCHRARTEEVVRAELAVPHYTPEAGDRVLISSGPDGLYVVGVLGAARQRAAHPAPDGVLTLSATRRIIIDAPEVELRGERTSVVAADLAIRSHRLEIEAVTLIERAEHTHRHAGDAHLSAGRSRTLVEGDCEIIAGRTSIVSEADTLIDGERVLLG